MPFDGERSASCADDGTDGEEMSMTLERTRAERAERLARDTLQVINLRSYLRALREEGAYHTNGRNGITLVKTARLRVVLEVLQAGTQLAEHRAPGPITVQVLEGAIRFHVEDEVFRVREAETLALPAGQPHSVEAVGDAAFLLTIAVEERKTGDDGPV
jgi:quercetin dioxygenase-like cupin family protein